MIWKASMCALVFLAGFVAALNLADLYPPQPNYEGAWWKALLAVGIALAGSTQAIGWSGRR